MRITVELKRDNGDKYSYVLFDEACAVYVETENGLEMRQDKDIAGYRITEAGNADC